MQDYIEKYNYAKLNNTPAPRVPDYVGQCLLLIATRLASKPNFSGYTYKDEMISDGIENCLMYIHNFDPNKTNNPFAYFTQIIKFAFLRRIEKEKKQQYIKLKKINNLVIDDTYDKEYGTQLVSVNEISDDFIRQYETRLTIKKKVVKVSNSISHIFNGD